MQKYVSSPLCILQPLSFWEIKGKEYQVKDDGLIKLEHIALAEQLAAHQLSSVCGHFSRE
jgi:hypothetical protein